jgi:hypothetical protein
MLGEHLGEPVEQTGPVGGPDENGARSHGGHRI